MVRPTDTTVAAAAGGRTAVLLVLVLLASTVMRLVGFDENAVDHYDEGAYAMSAQAVADGTWPAGGYPTQHYLSPPLLFGTAGLVARAGVDVQTALLAVVATLGVLTSLAAFVVVRGLVGPAAGLGAAALVAFSDYHVLYSRVGLTDVPFAFFLLLAIGACSLARQRWAWGWWVLAGACIGLAWNTKYHGWLAGVIAASALLFDVVRPPEGRTRGGVVGRFALSVIVACACYLPWALHVVDQPGGYATLLREHRSFLHGDRFVAQAAAQVRGQLYCDGWTSRASMLLVTLLVAVATRRLRPSIIAAGAGLAALACAVTGSAVAVALGLLGVGAMLADRTRRSWQLAAFAACFTILTPLYHNYVRLALPFMLATWCAAGAGIAVLVRGAARRPALGWSVGLVTLIVAAGLLATGHGPDLRDPATRSLATWGVRDGGPRAAADLARALPAGAAVDVVGEPPLVFHLRRLGFDARHRDHLEHLRGLERGGSAWVVLGRYGRKCNALAPLRRSRRLEVEKRAATFFAVGEVRRLNDMSPADALGDRAARNPGDDVELYSVHAR